MIEKYLEETAVACTLYELTEVLKVTQSPTTGVLDVMIAIGKLDMRHNIVDFFFLKDRYSEVQLSDMIKAASERRRTRLVNEFILRLEP